MSDPVPPLTGKRILLVEDDYFIASDMAACLETAGAIIVGPCPRSDQALLAIDGTIDGATLDAAVLDINLGAPDSGYAVAARLDQLGVPFLFASGNNPAELDPAFRARAFLEKPISPRLLVRSVVELIF